MAAYRSQINKINNYYEYANLKFLFTLADRFVLEMHNFVFPNIRQDTGHAAGCISVRFNAP
jgi:hypothetical protein